ncbi:LLM class flavin-dependent oxidoreductase [Amycolatopsis sp., V23-08]|uniref:LLM class flavin-dependent oxidoreductase n=1 Tax=Amycolatopsis heterodermiae TaxID=3110235 RepID=A0ABU5RK06_9PSEU|nr:LLM class flavin-dependent oxidoreductase [Amycolatopsis sp., V23-08]MEA5365899.1 LLM class flavin-dependent oxidoreductase [Amycolatopsis sp., V23-08]
MVLFGIGGSTAVSDAAHTLRQAVAADRGGLDLFSVSDHPYYADRLDAYAEIGVVLGRTERISGLVSVTNLPTRPAPMLARTVTSLSSLSGGRIVLGMGVGGLWDDIARLGFTQLTPGAAVRAFEEGIRLVKRLGGGGEPVTFDGEFYQVTALHPAEEPIPPVWTGSVGPKSLAVTGRIADGWMPGRAADWLSERYRTSRPVIDEAAAEAGRDPRDVVDVYNFPGRITAEPLPRTRDDDGRWIGGSPEQWIEELTGAVLDHDAHGFVLFGPGGRPPADGEVARWAEEIAPAVREAVAK